MKKISAIRMEETTARKLKIAAAIEEKPAGDFLDDLLEIWARQNDFEFQKRAEQAEH